MAGDYSPLQIRAWAEEYIPNAKLINEDKGALFCCPFHDDKNPSAYLWFEHNTFECKACGVKGDIFKVVAGIMRCTISAVKKVLHAQSAGIDDITVVSQEVVEHFHQQLIASAKHQAMLEKKGITLETAEAFKLGADGPRVTIPVYDIQGNVRNIRKYKPNAKTRKMINMKGHGAPRLYP